MVRHSLGWKAKFPTFTADISPLHHPGDAAVGGCSSSLGSLLGSLSCLMQHHGSNILGIIFPIKGIFPLALTRALTPFPKNSFGWQYKLRSGLCSHAFHRTDLKDPDIHVLDRWMPATKTHPVCTIHKDGMWLPQWIQNGHIRKHLIQNCETQRYSWERRRRRRCSSSGWWCDNDYENKYY